MPRKINPLAKDSKTLDRGFYSELLHLIGLEETSKGGQQFIQRQKEGDRSLGTLIENAIIQLENSENISLRKPPERLFNIALELALTWINRILFLKFLEAQLIAYHKNHKSFGFLNLEKVPSYRHLNNLFFYVLANKPTERSPHLKKTFAKVPYLNKSLFEPTKLEKSTIFISNLPDEKLSVFAATVLKDRNGNKQTGEINALEYLFEFLDAYDFSSQNNAALLGLIFEKINGYQDGSFFTPGFITMYMARETIRRSVVQKFNEFKGWNCQNIGNLYAKIEDKPEANQIINSLKICDPAVGSGHFLVSALNEIIAIKSELKILLDREEKTLRDYRVVVENDELIVSDDDGKFFEYYPNNQEKQRVQEALFHEKQTIIKNCLFGVDVNPNSVKICRLRLWIELLKNAYYKRDSKKNSNYEELETLPNLDINIKCGNSLISRFALDGTLRRENHNIFNNAFEWRFEFPEVLNNAGDFVGFDVVIGNPPYISAIALKKLVGESEYNYYKKQYATAKGTVDIYVYFFELGLKILRENGFLSYITPNRYLSVKYGLALRDFLIEKTRFIVIGDYSSVKVFKEAATYPIVSILQKKSNPGNYCFKSFTYVDELDNFEWREFDSKLLTYLSDRLLGFILSSKFPLTKKIVDNSVSLRNVGIINATSTAAEADAFHQYINEQEKDGFKLINTGTIDRYSTTWGLESLIDKKQKYLQPFLPKNQEILGENRFQLYCNQKILFAKIALSTEAFLDEEGEYASINTNCLHSFASKYDPYYVLGWLNSRLFQYAYQCFFDGLKMAGGYLPYTAPNLSNMFIKEASSQSQKAISQKVKQILNAKKSNPNANTTALEKEIDELIYQLYQLTEEEIKRVHLNFE